LQRLNSADKKYDVDTLLIYNDGCDIAKLLETVAILGKEGSVSAQKQIPDKFTYRRLMKFDGKDLRVF